VVNSEDLVVDQPLHEVEEAPSCEQKPRLEAEVRREAALLPGTQHEQHAERDEEPRADVEEAVRQCVRLQPGNCVDRVIVGMDDHVMPLKKLMDDDAVDESPEAETQ